MTKKVSSYILLFLAALIWGAAYPLLDYILILNEMSQNLINLLRFSFGFVALLPFVITKIKNLTKRDVLLSFICGACLFLGFLFLTLSISDGTPGVSAMMLNAGIFFVPLFSSIVSKKWPSKYVTLSVVVIFAGFILLFFKDGFFMPDSDFSISAAFGLLSALFFSIHIFILGKYHTKSEMSLCITCVQLFFVAILFLLYTLIFDFSAFTSITGTKSILPISALGLIATGIAYYFQTIASGNLTENTCNVVLSLESIFACIISILCGYDKLTWIFALGVLVVSGGVVLYGFKGEDTFEKAIKKDFVPNLSDKDQTVASKKDEIDKVK